MYTIIVGDSKLEVTASWLGDALKDLADALVALFTISASRASLIEEPGAYRYIFERGDDCLNIRVLKFDNIGCEGWSESEGEFVWSADCRFSVFITAFVGMSDGVLQEYGEDGYKQAWGSDYPVESLKQLSALSKSLDS